MGWNRGRSRKGEKRAKERKEKKGNDFIFIYIKQTKTNQDKSQKHENPATEPPYRNPHPPLNQIHAQSTVPVTVPVLQEKHDVGINGGKGGLVMGGSESSEFEEETDGFVSPL